MQVENKTSFFFYFLHSPVGMNEWKTLISFFFFSIPLDFESNGLDIILSSVFFFFFLLLVFLLKL